MFKNKKLYKTFMNNVKNDFYTREEIEDNLKVMPIKVLRKVGKTIIYSRFDGYNSIDVESELIWFDQLNRWQKEFFIKQRLHQVCL